MAVNISDPREFELPRVGIVELEDAETGETILVDTHDKNTTGGFRILSGDERRQRSDLFRSAGAGEVQVRADDPSYVDNLVRYFHQRERRR